MADKPVGVSRRKGSQAEAALFRLGAVALALHDLGPDRHLMGKLKKAAIEYGQEYRKEYPHG